MERVRDLVQGEGVSVVLAQERDRFAREPAYLYLLKQEFEYYGTRIRALSDGATTARRASLRRASSTNLLSSSAPKPLREPDAAGSGRLVRGR